MQQALAKASPPTSPQISRGADRDTLKCEDCRTRKVKASHRPQDNPVFTVQYPFKCSSSIHLLNLAHDSAIHQTETGLGAKRNALSVLNTGIPVAPGLNLGERGQNSPTLKYRPHLLQGRHQSHAPWCPDKMKRSPDRRLSDS
jgi:hypothetical protein